MASVRPAGTAVAGPVKILGVASCTPPHEIDQDTAKEFARRFFGQVLPDVERLLPVFDHAGIARPQFSVPLSWCEQGQGFGCRNDRYIDDALTLSRRAVDELLEQFTLSPSDIDHLVFVSQHRAPTQEGAGSPPS